MIINFFAARIRQTNLLNNDRPARKVGPSYYESLRARFPGELPPHLHGSVVGSRKFVEQSGNIVRENDSLFAREDEWISTFGVMSCKVLLCITSEKRRYMAHILTNDPVSKFTPLLNPGETALYSVINGPIKETQKDFHETETGKDSIFDPRFSLLIFKHNQIHFLKQDIYRDGSLDVLFSPTGKVYVLV